MRAILVCAGALGLPLFGLLAPVLAHANGAIAGTVRENGHPAAYANVLVVGLRLGAQTDEVGRFLIRDVPAGRQTVRVYFPGFPQRSEVVTVADGETTAVEVRLQLLSRPKDWHPPRPPERAVLDRMGKARLVRLFRLTGKQHYPWTGPWGIPAYDTLYSVPLHDREIADRLVDLLGRKKSFDAGFEWNEKKLCSPRPGVGVQFVDETGPIDVLLCFECAMLWVVVPAAPGAGGNFDREEHAFVAWVKAAFPDDPAIQSIQSSPARSDWKR